MVYAQQLLPLPLVPVAPCRQDGRVGLVSVIAVLLVIAFESTLALFGSTSWFVHPLGRGQSVPVLL